MFICDVYAVCFLIFESTDVVFGTKCTVSYLLSKMLVQLVVYPLNKYNEFDLMKRCFFLFLHLLEFLLVEMFEPMFAFIFLECT